METNAGLRAESLPFNQREAVRMLGLHTGGSFDPWRMMGPHNARERAKIMSFLMGRSMRRSESGVTAMQTSFWLLAGVSGKGNCIADREELFKLWAEAQA